MAAPGSQSSLLKHTNSKAKMKFQVVATVLLVFLLSVKDSISQSYGDYDPNTGVQENPDSPNYDYSNYPAQNNPNNGGPRNPGQRLPPFGRPNRNGQNSGGRRRPRPDYFDQDYTSQNDYGFAGQGGYRPRFPGRGNFPYGGQDYPSLYRPNVGRPRYPFLNRRSSGPSASQSQSEED